VRAKILTRFQLKNGVSYCSEFVALFLRVGKLKDEEHYRINFTSEYKIEAK
jgi:hypothetical protein